MLVLLEKEYQEAEDSHLQESSDQHSDNCPALPKIPEHWVLRFRKAQPRVDSYKLQSAEPLMTIICCLQGG